MKLAFPSTAFVCLVGVLRCASAVSLSQDSVQVSNRLYLDSANRTVVTNLTRVHGPVEDIIHDVAETAKSHAAQAANATVDAVRLIVDAAQNALVELENATLRLQYRNKIECHDWATQMTYKPNLRTYVMRGKHAVRTFYTWFRPVASAVNSTGFAVRSILHVAGFMYLADEVNVSMKKIMDDMNQSIVEFVLAEGDFVELQNLGKDYTSARKTSEASSEVKKSINTGIAKIETHLGSTMTRMTTVRTKFHQLFDILVKHLRATIDGGMEPINVSNLNDTLADLPPQVDNILSNIKDSFTALSLALNQTDTLFRKTINVKSWASNLQGISLLSLVTSVCAAWFVSV